MWSASLSSLLHLCALSSYPSSSAQVGSGKRRLGKGTRSYEASIFVHARCMILFVEKPLSLPQRLYTEATSILAMPFLHMATCDSPFQFLRSLHPPGGFLAEEPLKKPSPADFHRIHMQTLDTTAIALLSAGMHLTPSVPPLTTLHQVGTAP